MELGYARVSTAKQDLDRQVEALVAAGVARDKIFLDKKSGATTDRPGLRAVLAYAREGDVIVVHTLDRLGRTVRDTLNLIHDLTDRGVGVRNL
ncbi:MAG TPA: resolvase, partial [Micrococcales bacterium]|nr:resolvase [Micrococcales bacterium]